MMSDSHSLLHVGTQCSHPFCNQVDFLPIQCQCEKKFCDGHYKPEDHDCPVKPTESTTEQLQPTLKPIKRCALPNCQNLALDAFNYNSTPTCSKCQVSFCAQHRYPDSHDCSPPVKTGSQKNEDARNLLMKHFPKKTGTSKPSDKSRKPLTAQQRKIELMKIRHHAKPGDPKDQAVSLPVDQRVNVKVKAGDVEKVYWFRKNLSTGKVLDCLSRHFNLSNTQPLRLFHLEGVPLQNDSVFAEEIEDGDTVLIEHVPQT